MPIEGGNIVLRSHTSAAPSFKFRTDWISAGRPEEWELQFDLTFTRWNYPTPTKVAANGMKGNYLQFDIVTTDKHVPHNFLHIGGYNGLSRNVIKGSALSQKPGKFLPTGFVGAATVVKPIADVGAGPYAVKLRRQKSGANYKLSLQVSGSDRVLMTQASSTATTKMSNVEMRLIPFPDATAVESGKYGEVVISNLRLVKLVSTVLYQQQFSSAVVPSGWTGVVGGGRLKVTKASGAARHDFLSTYSVGVPRTADDFTFSFEFRPDSSNWAANPSPASGANSVFNYPSLYLVVGSELSTIFHIGGASDGSTWVSKGESSSQYTVTNTTVPIQVQCVRTGNTISVSVGNGDAVTQPASGAVAEIDLALMAYGSDGAAGASEAAIGWIDNVLWTKAAS